MTVMLPHGSYKPSTAPWIGQIPAHWDEKPLFALARERRESNAGMRENNLLSLSYGRIVRKDINTNQGLLPESFETYQIVEAGDVVFRLTDLQNDQRSLRSALCGERGIITSAYTAVIIEGAAPAFFSYLMRAYDVQKVFYSMGGGLRQSLKYDDLRRMPIPLPSGMEQKMIVAFLDRETERIDHLIEKKGKFIDLLREKRTAMIAHTVTKGLDTDAPMTSSGVKWLGEVPSSWKVTPLKYLCRVKTGSRDTAHAVLGGGYPFFVRSQTVEEIDTYSADCEAILTAGDGAGVGKVYHYYNGKFDFHQRVYMLSKFEGIRGRYLFYYLSALFAAVALDGGAKSTVDSLRMPVFMGFAVAHPGLSEQDRILEFLDRQVQRIDDLVHKTERSIELLKEHRSALITAAVTGKIDVRGLAAKNMKAAA